VRAVELIGFFWLCTGSFGEESSNTAGRVQVRPLLALGAPDTVLV
jgi:hypothetical protein